MPLIDYMRVRWVDPDGAVAREKKPKRSQRVYLSDTVEVGENEPGEWRLEVLLADDVVDSQLFRVE